MNIQVLSVLIIITVPASTTGDVRVFGQVGKRVILPMPTEGTDAGKTYISWQIESEPSIVVITRNPFGQDKIATGWKGKVSISKNEYSLVIENIQAEDFKTFTCVLRTSFSTISSTRYQLSAINVVAEPAGPVLAGQSLTLSCDVELQTATRLTMHWENPQRKDMTAEQNAQGATKRTLTVAKVTGEDNGKWTCVVECDNRRYVGKLSVTVLDLSPADSSPRYASVSSTPLQVPCSLLSHITWKDLKAAGLRGGHWTFTPSVPAAAPQRLFTLQQGDSPVWEEGLKRGLSMQNKLANDLSLWRKTVTTADRGDYTCALEFENGLTWSRNVRVEVLQLFSSPEKDVFAGQQVNLSCSLGHNLASHLQVKWIPPKPPGQPSLGHAADPTLLTIPEASDKHSGEWRCELCQNGTPCTSAKLTLKIERAPMGVWLLVTICSVAVISILIPAIVLIQRQRKRKTKTRHPKRRFCRCKHPKPKGFYRN
ncbi:CD4-1 molecule [Lampris incognitus]|uniref:CD4-1 molecule n=1 Tax=Lampris incognitus TaxID=2546036 RepID=UPI0024B4E369|nr:CD4-1 molecule [Lampris incognitus]XP_056142127.1 CD4-1 molecule [Lampris incognitus]XP_056142128.1 CD4-1 molecule [Lampris incognitus]